MNAVPENVSRTSQVRAVLRGLHASLTGVEISAVASRDGITIASMLNASSDEDRVGALCASLLALADRAGREVDRGDLRQLILDGVKGPMLLTLVGDGTVLAVAADRQTNLGRLILKTREVSAQLDTLLRAAETPRALP